MCGIVSFESLAAADNGDCDQRSQPEQGKDYNVTSSIPLAITDITTSLWIQNRLLLNHPAACDGVEYFGPCEPDSSPFVNPCTGPSPPGRSHSLTAPCAPPTNRSIPASTA